MHAADDQDYMELLEELDKGINDMEAGRVTEHEESMRLLIQKYNSYVLKTNHKNPS